MPAVSDLAAVIIPARYASSRLPAKALAQLQGQTMIERVYRRALLAKSLDAVVVATDDERIRDVVAAAGGRVVMTDSRHRSGSDRVAEVARELDYDIVVNVQGDLPLLEPAWVDDLVALLRARAGLGMATIAVPVQSLAELNDPSVVKVVCNSEGRALYFSRAPLPFDRDDPENYSRALHHVGIYAYRKETLLRFSALPPGELETAEKLEQLRAIENGIDIAVVRVDAAAPLEVDTSEDLERVRGALAEAAALE